MHCIWSILSQSLDHVIFQFKDTVVKAPCDIKIFHQNPFIWVHCLDLNNRFELSLASFPILKLKCLYGHVCFTMDLSEWGIVIFPNCEGVLQKFAGVKSPCCIEVKSSAVFNVSKLVLLLISMAKLCNEKCLRPLNRSCRSRPVYFVFFSFGVQPVCIRLWRLFWTLHADNLERLYLYLVPKRLPQKVTCIPLLDLWFSSHIKVAPEETEHGEEAKIAAVGTLIIQVAWQQQLMQCILRKTQQIGWLCDYAKTHVWQS